MRSIKSNGPDLYNNDRDKAFKYFKLRGIPEGSKELNETRANQADNASIWEEEWAFAHKALVGYAKKNKVEKIIDMLFGIGRAHKGLENYDLSYLYLKSALFLADRLNHDNLKIQLILDLSVLLFISNSKNEFEDFKKMILEKLLPGGNPLKQTADLSHNLFKEGLKLQQWRDKKGKPIKSHLKHATGYYEVTLFINKNLGDQNAIAFTLYNLGDIWKELGDMNKARLYWQESLNIFSKKGDNKHVLELKKRLL